MKYMYCWIVLVLVCIPHLGYSKNNSFPLLPVKTDWQRIDITDLGSIDLPPTLEIQGLEYKKGMDNYRAFGKIPVLVAQQKELNNGDKESSKRYARVMIETIYGKDGDFEKLNFNIKKLRVDSIGQLDKDLKTQCDKGLNKINQKLIEWYPVTLEKINGMSCIHISYTRQLYNNPVEKVDLYRFQNNDRIHGLILSYRISESEIWKNDFDAVLKSFRVSNIR